ncbi:sucrase ferredoxin [Nocardia otitidiscaviarum]|uniref:sucrase ferredoxin n=1 Tax=Nocardia otitidiscaviarum TaxID=1823 RepID=UPI000B1FABC1|nr:sucrase ferredoxin [Nocardia otitidiscaviarum]
MTAFAGLPCTTAAWEVPLPGSATHITGWLCVEQPGAWGRDVIGDEVLGPDITAELAARTKAARVRPTLIRRPGRHEFTGVRTVLLVSSHPERPWCERFEITDLNQLLDFDPHLLNGPPPGIGAPVADPPVLVCAHGKRDQCCARLGRPIAAHLAAAHPGRVWECSHTGGHRFAPAVVLLPSGLTYGRLTADTALETLAAADRNTLSLTGFRGRSGHSPVEQVAEITVREHLRDIGDDTAVALNALTVTADSATWGTAEAADQASLAEADTSAGNTEVPASIAPAAARLGDEAAPADPATFAGAAQVTHRDGRRWLVTVHTSAYAPRQASCGAAPKPVKALRATRLHRLE